MLQPANRTMEKPRPDNSGRPRVRTLTREQEQALGDLALLGGPAFMIGLWGLASFTSGLLSMASLIA